MRSLGLVACVILVAASVLPAVGAVASVGSLPIYPGAKFQFEMTLTEKDFLPAIKQFIPMVPGIAGAAIPELAPSAAQGDKAEKMEKLRGELMGEKIAKGLSAAVAGLTRISVTGYNVPKGVGSDKIAAFYMLKLGLSKGWQQTLRAEDPRGSFRLYVKPELEGMFGFGMQNTQVAVFRTEGRIDVEQIAKLVGDLIPMALSMRPGPPAPETPPVVVEEAPVPAPTPAPGDTGSEPPANPAQ